MFDHINWSVPWLAPYKTIGERLAEQILSGSPVHKALNDSLHEHPITDCAIRFVPQEESNGAAAYESFIWQTKTVPTRDNLHDFFNGLVWLHFPKIKTQLNALQNAAIEAQGIRTTRGKLRDALTLFDENAAFLIAPQHQLQALQRMAWQDLFITNRTDWDASQLVLFGHALLEKLVTPRKAITAHVYCPPSPIAKMDDLAISHLLTPEHLQTKPYAPLPVMGVPAWCADNVDAAFYDDAQVFRHAVK